ncbi:hypothetical protein QOZ80_3BG0268260 [Eleusine coracana subsp. coracana]|nr:hypothetical protein QOZ80_3BG0268260 [Eleusine coracana subsp. coracana]
MALQLLVDACHAVLLDDGFDTPPTAAAVSLIRGTIDKIGPDDVALVDEVLFLEETNNGGAGHHNDPPIITCKTVYEWDNFTITVFFLPPGAAMPLHSHPGLTVFSKLLLGSAHVVAYDWVRPSVYTGSGSGSGSTMTMLAEKALDHEFTAACGAWVLFPDSGGNMHRFVAGEDGPCAFLDVVTPSYSPAKQGPCSFYRDLPYDLHPDVESRNQTEEQKHRLAWLQGSTSLRS